jgi:hypothetical protein
MTLKRNQLNWRLGFFRLWAVGSALFVIAVASLNYNEIKAQFDAYYVEWPGEPVVPQLCGNARGIAGTDFSTKQGQNPGPWDLYAKPNPFDNCWFEMSKFRRLYPEFNNLSDKQLSSKLYSELLPDAPWVKNPWTALRMWAAIGVGIPLSVLIVGAALGWAFSGFAASTRHRDSKIDVIDGGPEK